ncbi:uncharacterized protein BX663DRAFT_500942 [Cokeromyces recurvatus]|uniref:uncharacterized protein n=1 Tax=Cokeromyces recurvatus TaxID=90255 RepID=UPI00221E69F5|nr:uncharacterized protein BX663DRAFT_500942 [Cokeromyces recurvatus]KAI7905799.1 hypothetical protein BX663DRAFT_500942 [Cokeromyces recurvatus]
MGCCSSVPSNDDNRETTNCTSEQSQSQPQQTTEIQQHQSSLSTKELSIHSIEKQENITTTEWPICVRLSNNGQDIHIKVPTQPPYLTLAGLRRTLLPHLESIKYTRVKFIYLGRILTDQYVIVPTQQSDPDSPLPPPKNRTIQIQKEGVIQAMILTK